MNKNNPVRTCVACKVKFSQNLLKRYRLVGKNLECGKGDSRSFYLCDGCLQKDDKILKKIIDKQTKGALGLDAPKLKEILLNEQC